jgi:hypothetical protein
MEEETMDLEEFKAKLDELLAGAEIYIPWPQLAEILRDRATPWRRLTESSPPLGGGRRNGRTSPNGR